MVNGFIWSRSDRVGRFDALEHVIVQSFLVRPIWSLPKLTLPSNAKCGIMYRYLLATVLSALLTC